jgi:hypothetical protein
MATATVPQQSKSAVVVSIQQSSPKVETISQAEVALLLSLRRRMHDLEEQIDAAEASLKGQLQAGAIVEPGTFRAYLKTTERRSVSWKGVCERELGETYCKRVLAGTRPDTFINLIVEA